MRCTLVSGPRAFPGVEGGTLSLWSMVLAGGGGNPVLFLTGGEEEVRGYPSQVLEQGIPGWRRGESVQKCRLRSGVSPSEQGIPCWRRGGVCTQVRS